MNLGRDPGGIKHMFQYSLDDHAVKRLVGKGQLVGIADEGRIVGGVDVSSNKFDSRVPINALETFPHRASSDDQDSRPRRILTKQGRKSGCVPGRYRVPPVGQPEEETADACACRIPGENLS